jgi:hypothetical protein
MTHNAQALNIIKTAVAAGKIQEGIEQHFIQIAPANLSAPVSHQDMCAIAVKLNTELSIQNISVSYTDTNCNLYFRGSQADLTDLQYEYGQSKGAAPLAVVDSKWASTTEETVASVTGQDINL